MDLAAQTRLKKFLIEEILRYGIIRAEAGKKFILNGGAESDWIVNFKDVALRKGGKASRWAAYLLLEELAQHFPQVKQVGGIAMGGVPLMTAVTLMGGIEGKNLDGFYVRKEPKAHGTGRQIDGVFDPALPCVLVEDVTTSGASVNDNIDIITKAGGQVVGVITVLDRGTDTAARFARRGIAFHALLTKKDLGLL